MMDDALLLTGSAATNDVRPQSMKEFMLYTAPHPDELYSQSSSTLSRQVAALIVAFRFAYASHENCVAAFLRFVALRPAIAHFPFQQQEQ